MSNILGTIFVIAAVGLASYIIYQDHKNLARKAREDSEFWDIIINQEWDFEDTE